MSVRDKVFVTAFFAWFIGALPLVLLVKVFSHEAAFIVGLVWGIASLAASIAGALWTVWTA